MAQTKGKTTKSTSAKGGGAKSGGTKGKNSAAARTNPVRREVGALVCLFLGLFSFIGYFKVDAWFITFFCGLVKGLIGWGFYILPPALILCAGVLGFHRGRPVTFRTVSILLSTLLMGALAHLLFDRTGADFSTKLVKLLFEGGKNMECGGLLGGLLAMLLKSAFSVYGALPVLLASFLFFLMMGFSITPSKIIEYFKNRPKLEYIPEPEPEPELLPVTKEAQLKPAARRARKAIDIPLDGEELPDEPKQSFFNKKPGVKTPDQFFNEHTAGVEPVTIEEAAVIAGVPVTEIAAPVDTAERRKASPAGTPEFRPAAVTQEISDPPKAKKTAAVEEDIAAEIEQSMAEQIAEYKYPPITLLKTGGANSVDGREEMSLNRERLENTLRSFGVSAAITNITRGPTVTRYDLELDIGVKLSKLTSLAGDLALSLGVSGVRIAPIPDKISTVGVEVPNKLVSTVYLRDIIDSPAFKNSASKLTFAIGEDIGGDAVVGNIAKLPHMLIAGTTGSGKSVCMNSLILSLLYKATPEEVRLIMIDPKMVELGIYNGIPHLFVPVVTDPKKAAGALQWAVVEMLKRYRLFSEIGVRDLAGYNAYQKKTNQSTIPQVVIVIDELADLMLVASKEVEESICRIAQMGRASGMHLVIATQRPSADVITGLMKANIPSRVAFAVSSAMESRIILDAGGAEQLVGSGDMLYAPLGSGKPRRIQGAFVSDEEREDVINFIKASSSAEYSEEILAEIEKAAEGKKSSVKSDNQEQEDSEEPFANYDELLPQAVDVIFDTKQASVSMLQRRLKLGYSRAARIIDQMEELGVVGPFEGSKPRQIIITREQWQEMQMINGTAPVEQITQMQIDMPEPEEDGAEDAPW